MSGRLPPVRHWRTGEVCSLPAELWSGEERPPAGERWLAPGLFDLQVNGFAGVDFQADRLEADELDRAVRAFETCGGTRFLLTLITDHWDRLLAKLDRLRTLREASPRLRRAIAGWHIEGPFLSQQPGFHGAHDPTRMLDPTSARLRELRAAAGPGPLLLTLAPERRGAIAAIAEAVALGFTVSLGHTDASADCLREAVAAGATGFTHLGNACPQLLDRHDNILWRVLDTPGLIVSLIADKRHVAPALFRLIHRALPPERIVYVTDAMAAAGAPPGRYRLGALEMEVGTDRVVRQPGQSNFAGSALTPVEAVFHAVEMLGQPWPVCWERMSLAPARWLGLPAPEPPAVSEGCVLELERPDRPGRLQVFRKG